MADDYDAGSIQVLEGLEAVRKRPGMYLGDPHDGSALHHCIWEVVDNSVDEHLAGHTTQIDIVLNDDHSLPSVIMDEVFQSVSTKNLEFQQRKSS